ncbi:sulfatase [Amycolatopsis sp.]|uniref:sulfatase n=1 Tax=Amycolatopsis sp. TaxID=37632 RepID=UPI002C414315|nr:sulfatase [Amycolatopsis sp.]HVV08480.1 sulfatase [Amycolatopsis sp.]
MSTPAAPPPRGQARRIAVQVLTVLGGLLIVAALVVPNDLNLLTPWAFPRIPVEALVGFGLVLLLPARARRVVAVIAGILLALLTIIKITDMGFIVAFERPFDLVTDWSFFGPAFGLLEDSAGHAGAVAAVIGIAVLAVGFAVALVFASLRLTKLAAGHRTTAFRTLAVLSVIWLVCAVFGLQFAENQPLAARTTASLAYHDAVQVGQEIKDEKAFAQESSVDAYRNTAPDQLLTALHGKNVLLVFVESYGRVAVQDSDIAPKVDAVLDSGTASLRAAGFDARSGFLTSSTTGGGSWLAHSTLETGLWINNQKRYTTVTSSDRLTMASAFRHAGWRTVNDQPANFADWPEGEFYDYSQRYDFRSIGYKGPGFGYASMPDQFAMAQFQQAELAKPGHPPVMGEIDLVSSHWPWAPLPRMVGWNELGDGSIFGPMPAQGKTTGEVWSDPAKVRAAYGDSIVYSLDTLISYLRTYGDDNTVLLFLGDHQPNTAVTGGEGAGRDVPISIVAKDPAVLQAISGWNWQPGLHPGPQAPVWPMSDFRDRFFAAYSPKSP